MVGWWLDTDPVTFYHGTHKSKVQLILKTGLLPPKEGYTAGWVSLALDPATARGYASMSGEGGETSFRNAGMKAKTVPMTERVVIVLNIPQSYFLPRMGPALGFKDLDKLINQERYEGERTHWIDKITTLYGMRGQKLPFGIEGKFDTEYYAKTEIRLPFVPKEFISGYMSHF